VKTMAMCRSTAGSTTLHPQSLFSKLVFGESGILGEGYMDTAEAQLLSFVQTLANHPKEVVVNRLNGNPVVFEITIRKEDSAEVNSKLNVIQAIAGYTTGLLDTKVVVKILEK
jgi:hypothetical protein